MPELKSINASDITDDMEIFTEEMIDKLARIFAKDALEKFQAQQQQSA